jgi:POT family proton-dependent oligopeptide transporter
VGTFFVLRDACTLIAVLTAAVIQGSPFSGWSWTAQQAGALYGTYAMMLYLTPIIGGIIADKYIGSRKAVIIGSAIMTLGHAAMAFDTRLCFPWFSVSSYRNGFLQA